jgi:hypothetical protein
MPVDVAMHEPRSGVVSLETDGNVVAGSTQADNVTTRRVVVVVIGLTSRANNVKGVTVKMEGVRSTSNTSRHGHFDDLVPLEVEDRALRHELVSSELPTQELKEDGERG